MGVGRGLGRTKVELPQKTGDASLSPGPQLKQYFNKRHYFFSSSGKKKKPNKPTPQHIG